VADLRGESPNLADLDVFKELERWEAILQSIPDLPGDEPSCDKLDARPPDDLTPDI
ncbi:unnamed protein product, partial [Ectocarpus sp. 12 AP-2014]